MLYFDRDSITLRLEMLPLRSRTAFALACAEQVLPFYRDFCERRLNGSWGLLRSITDELWEQLVQNVVAPNQEFLKGYPLLAPNDDWPTVDFVSLAPLAENAVLALGSACECHASGNAEHAALAAEQAIEAADYLAQKAGNWDYRATGNEEKIVGSRILQGELRRQANELEMLERTLEKEGDYLCCLNSLRRRSTASGDLLHGDTLSFMKA